MSISGSPVSPYTSGSISVRVTSAMPVVLRSRVPAKMPSCMFTPRSDRADCSPKTHEIASEIFDLPQPFGPTIAATPSPWNFSSVRSQNDLNPRICSFFNLSNLHSFAYIGLEPPKGRQNAAQNFTGPGKRVDARATLLTVQQVVNLQNPIFCVYLSKTPLSCTMIAPNGPSSHRA